MTSAKKKEQNQANYLANREERKRKARERARVRRQREKDQREKARASQSLRFDDFYECKQSASQTRDDSCMANTRNSQPHERTIFEDTKLLENVAKTTDKNAAISTKEQQMSDSYDEISSSKFQPLKLVSSKQGSVSMFQLPQYSTISVSGDRKKKSETRKKISDSISVIPQIKLVSASQLSARISDAENEVSVPSKVDLSFSSHVSDKIDYQAFLARIIGGLPLLLGLLALLGSTFLVVSENIVRFQAAGLRMPNLMGWVLEIAIVSLSFYAPRVLWSFSTKKDITNLLKVSAKLISAKLVLVVLVVFSLSTSVVSDRVAGVEKIASVSAKAGDQSLSKQIGISVAALQDFQRKGESGNIKATQRKLADLRAQQKETLKSDDVKELKSAYLSEQYINMAAKAIPLLISITFAHLLGAAFRKKKIFAVQ